MQLKGQIKKNWKVVAAATAVSAIGLSGLAVANPGNGNAEPDPINLKDRTTITQVSDSVGFTGIDFASLATASADTANDSPFDDLTTATDDSPDTASPSPDTATDSPDTATVSAETSSPDTPDSPDSPDDSAD